MQQYEQSCESGQDTKYNQSIKVKLIKNQKKIKYWHGSKKGKHLLNALKN